jgi:hypothetical protein
LLISYFLIFDFVVINTAFEVITSMLTEITAGIIFVLMFTDPIKKYFKTEEEVLGKIISEK